MSIAVQTEEAPTMSLLRHGVPLSLLFDLLDSDGPGSSEIFALEAARDVAHPQ